MLGQKRAHRLRRLAAAAVASDSGVALLQRRLRRRPHLRATGAVTNSANSSASPAATDAGGIADPPNARRRMASTTANFEEAVATTMVNGTATSSAAHAPRSTPFTRGLHDAPPTRRRHAGAVPAAPAPPPALDLASIVIGPSPTPTMKQRPPTSTR